MTNNNLTKRRCLGCGGTLVGESFHAPNDCLIHVKAQLQRLSDAAVALDRLWADWERDALRPEVEEAAGELGRVLEALREEYASAFWGRMGELAEQKDFAALAQLIVDHYEYTGTTKVTICGPSKKED